MTPYVRRSGLPADILAMHRMLVQDALAGGPAAFIR